MYRNMISFLTLLIVTALMTGCNTFGGRQVRLDDNWGRASQTIAYNQVRDMDAGADSKPVDGLEGKSVDHTYEKYQQSFKTEENTSTVFNINLSEK